MTGSSSSSAMAGPKAASGDRQECGADRERVYRPDSHGPCESAASADDHQPQAEAERCPVQCDDSADSADDAGEQNGCCGAVHTKNSAARARVRKAGLQGEQAG